MPDFDAKVDLTVPGCALATWDDPAILAAPSRLNPNPNHPHRYVRIVPGASMLVPNTTTIRVFASVGGVDAPLDTALGGRLFLWSWVEWSGLFPPSIVPTSGQTSEVHVDITTSHLGHFALLAWRDGGGGVILHFDSEL